MSRERKDNAKLIPNES